MSANIVLVGFMGAGKSVVAKNLAAILKREVVSTDQFIEDKEKRPISQIFKESGEAYFRQVEKDVVALLSKRKNLIIDCGGGVVINQQNIDNLKKEGIVFYLSTSPEVIYDRVKGQGHRPLLDVPDPLATIKQILSVRQFHYAQANHTIDTTYRSAQDVVDEILKIIARG